MAEICWQQQQEQPPVVARSLHVATATTAAGTASVSHLVHRLQIVAAVLSAWPWPADWEELLLLLPVCCICCRCLCAAALSSPPCPRPQPRRHPSCHSRCQLMLLACVSLKLRWWFNEYDEHVCVCVSVWVCMITCDDKNVCYVCPCVCVFWHEQATCNQVFF